MFTFLTFIRVLGIVHPTLVNAVDETNENQRERNLSHRMYLCPIY
jgi:hypothetical protein